MSKSDLVDKIQKLNKYCLSHVDDSYRVHLNRLKGIQILNDIVDETQLSDLSANQIVTMVWSSISCMHHFYIRLRIQGGCMAWTRRNQTRKAIRTYEKLIRFSLPYTYNIVLNAIITFYTESHMWHTEYLCATLLKRLLLVSKEGAMTIHSILDIAEETSNRNIMEARQVIRVLYQVLETYPWHDMDDFLMVRLLTMYHRSIVPADNAFDYVQLRKGIEVTIRHIMVNISSEGLLKVIKVMIGWIYGEDITDDALLHFGNLIEYAALLHQTYLYRDSLQPDLFPMILELVGSENRLYSLLGNRILQNLMDRHRNVTSFDTPRIFLVNLSFNIIVGRYNSEDKAFVRIYRELIHTSLVNLECTYASIAILVVEVPCGYMAAAIVCLSMAIQETAISTEDIGLESSHRLHATVMSLISLVCWVHDAHIFYEYVITIMTRRAKYAPHLNPPLRATYQYAQHHILWNKPELFFEDWEARYGLWKCFRTRRPKLDSCS
ncbi:hypothetical protein RI129_010346 [Pyrocoelia pectoralis]|uniref:Uncharacterized protein n=1 Tax=Pyrocoelia pectoralis TaxID=417401 RepID=A0AAN7V914_9COLE